MKIPMQLILDDMEEFHGTLVNVDGKEPKLWYQMVDYDSSVGMYEDVLYFAAAWEFPEDTVDKGLVCIGKPTLSLMEKNEILYFETDAAPAQVSAKIQKIFHRFHRWEDSLREALWEEKPLDALFRRAVTVFDNSMFVHDENFYLLASVNQTPMQHAWEYDAVQGSYILPLEILNDFKVNKDYLSTMHTEGPSVFPAETFGYAILYQNLWYNKKYRGRICINEIKRKIRPGDFFLLDYFSKVVLEVLKAGEGKVLQHTRSLSRVLFRMLEGERIDTGTLDRILLQYGWTAKDEYFCACFFPEDRDIRTHSVQYFCSRLMDEFPEICAFLYEKCVVMLVNSTMNEMNPASFGNRAAVILRESLMKVGISSLYRDLSLFPYYYEQAVCAYETGKKKHDTFWSYRFDDYQTDYILENALKKFPARLLCSQEILWLENYDRTHTAELGKTLRIYLENDRNLARTAEILEIHRSTLLYRIGRIKEITHLELEDPKEKFRLILSFALIDYSRG
ncbi:MAG: PucR family transcriptional regulator [Ruminococcus sp.]|jgi:hypothetical protein